MIPTFVSVAKKMKKKSTSSELQWGFRRRGKRKLRRIKHNILLPLRLKQSINFRIKFYAWLPMEYNWTRFFMRRFVALPTFQSAVLFTYDTSCWLVAKTFMIDPISSNVIWNRSFWPSQSNTWCFIYIFD